MSLASFVGDPDDGCSCCECDDGEVSGGGGGIKSSSLLVGVVGVVGVSVDVGEYGSDGDGEDERVGGNGSWSGDLMGDGVSGGGNGGGGGGD